MTNIVTSSVTHPILKYQFSFTNKKNAWNKYITSIDGSNHTTKRESEQQPTTKNEEEMEINPFMPQIMRRRYFFSSDTFNSMNV